MSFSRREADARGHNSGADGIAGIWPFTPMLGLLRLDLNARPTPDQASAETVAPEFKPT